MDFSGFVVLCSFLLGGFVVVFVFFCCFLWYFVVPYLSSLLDFWGLGVLFFFCNEGHGRLVWQTPLMSQEPRTLLFALLQADAFEARRDGAS